MKKDTYITVANMRGLARAMDGECLSQRCRGYHGELRWRCAHGHDWTATPHSIIYHNTWCPHPKCDERRQTIADMHAFAESRGGTFESRTYTNARDPHFFKCAQGHRFSATPAEIRRTVEWCPKCRKNGRLTPAVLKRLKKIVGPLSDRHIRRLVSQGKLSV